MPLIKCPDCAAECSDLAPACPKCGRPLGGQKSLATKNLGFGGFVYSMMLIVGILIAIFSAEMQPLGVLLAITGGILLLARLKIWAGVDRK